MKKFENAKLEFVTFEVNDIITTSTGFDGDEIPE